MWSIMLKISCLLDILLFVIANKIGHVKFKNLTRGLYVYRDTPISRLIFVGFYLFYIRFSHFFYLISIQGILLRINKSISQRKPTR